MELQSQHIAGRRKLTRAEFHRMAELGFFADERVELLYGELFKVTIGPPHSHLVKVLTKLFIQALGDRADVLVQSPFAASDVSEPEPDLAIVPAGDYRNDHPSTAFLLIEVSDSTLEIDRGKKVPLYAEARVPEYWIVDVEAGAIEVYRQPVGARYESITRYVVRQTVSPAAFPDIKVSVDALFG